MFRKPVIAILIIFLLVCAITGCSMPIGSIYGKNTEDDFITDPIWLVPRRQLYQIDERFMRNEDFQIFIVDNNLVREIPPDTRGVTVEISGNHNLSTEFRYTVYSTQQEFFRVGLHRVTVEYDGRTSWYAVEVFSPNNGSGIGGDDGIGIIWAD